MATDFPLLCVGPNSPASIWYLWQVRWRNGKVLVYPRQLSGAAGGCCFGGSCDGSRDAFCPQKQKNIAGALAFWMANASELLNFIKQDRDLSRITLDAQDVLAHLVQMAFKYGTRVGRRHCFRKI